MNEKLILILRFQISSKKSRSRFHFLVQIIAQKMKFSIKNFLSMCDQVHRDLTSSLLWTLNRFHTMFWCFCCWLGTNKCRLGIIFVCGFENHPSSGFFKYFFMSGYWSNHLALNWVCETEFSTANSGMMLSSIRIFSNVAYK